MRLSHARSNAARARRCAPSSRRGPPSRCPSTSPRPIGSPSSTPSSRWRWSRCSSRAPTRQDAIGRAYDRLVRACDAALKRPWVTIGILSAGTFIVLAWVASSVLLRFPNSGDEYCYLLQARLWLDGRAWYAEHPVQPFFDFLHIRVLDGRVFSVFPPAGRP